MHLITAHILLSKSKTINKTEEICLPHLYNKPVLEPDGTQLSAVLQVIDTAEIKSTVPSLQTTMIEIQSALQALPGRLGEAEHSISEVEDDFKESEVQVMKNCNDIKTMKANLIDLESHSR
ncbi:unnamed protein product [Caretta caretta]